MSKEKGKEGRGNGEWEEERGREGKKNRERWRER